MMRTYTDMMGRKVEVPYLPKRIVSVVPSQTELLYDLGLSEEVVGITKFCVHPESWFRSKTRIGGTKKLDMVKIRSLQPDLIIANKEENTQEQVEELAKEFPVWISDIHDLPGALQMIRNVGAIVGKEHKGELLAAEIETGFAQLQQATEKKRVAYFIWYRPWMSTGGDTFISHMIEAIGWQNVLAVKSRYPEITLEELKTFDPQLVLLSSEPFLFRQKHIYEVKEILPGADVRLVDGEMFSWYGSRLLKAVDYFNSLVNS